MLIFIPILVAALNTLNLDAVTQPISKMLEVFLLALPDIFAAALILIVSNVIGKILAGLLTNILEGFGFNAILAKLGIGGREIAGRELDEWVRSMKDKKTLEKNVFTR